MTPTALARSPARLWRAARLPLAVGALVVLTGVLVAAVSDRGQRGYLDPAAIDDLGSRAVVEVLRDRGVTVTPTGDTALVRSAGPATTVVVPFPSSLPDAELAALRATAADVVLVQPGYEVGRIAPGLEVTALSASGELRDPGCGLRAAVAAGPLAPDGSLYRADGATACYPEELGAALVEVGDGDRTVTALGDAAPLLNGTITDEGHAALALGLLGRHAELLWFDPDPADLATGEERSFDELVPDGVRWAALQLGVAAVLLVLWRARRLGPVVREPLPVVVRASEAVEGRARLYRRAGARAHAAETLREATRARLRPLVGLPADAAPAELVDAVGARTGRGAGTLLYGPPPGDDAALVALARALDECEGEVRRS
jgi:hypothetical protein